ncbi:MAG: alpha/beta hydrolase [Bacteroidales bacterium]|nr:alpha/beta hydrolase [Bacteroidales bacterium]
MQNSIEKDININGVNVHYRTGGSGAPVILMHGWGCDSSTLSLFQRVAMEHNSFYNIDLPGFGKSGEPPTPWGIEEYTAMLEEFVKALGLSNIILLGHSFGGRIAILYSSRNPVRKLVLVDAAGVKPKRSLDYYFKVYSYKLAKWLYPTIVGKEKAEEMIENMRSRRGSYDYVNCSPMMRQVMVKVVNTDLRHAMPRIKAPTQLIWGENDTATPMRDAKIMLKLIPDAGLVSFPGAGHFSFVDNPYQSAAVFRRFIYPTLNNSAE